MGVPGRELSMFDQERIRRWLADEPPRSVRWIARALGVTRETVRRYRERQQQQQEPKT